MSISQIFVCWFLRIQYEVQIYSSIKRPLTYDEWLAKQLEVERKIAAEKKLQDDEINRKKLDEEDK